ncbi:DUF971 family protein [Alteromonadaceae bacterium 2753L.S.0a.02]|nr:DUF971 family protein [Alteromonadaceae bacterium 2753L.S.0a.02]
MQPTTIKLHRKSKTLEISWGDANYQLSAEYLRVFSPSAEVTGHGPGQEVLQLNKQDVAVNGVEPQGNYAIKLLFSDGHDSGIYSWTYLKELAEKHDQNWQAYKARVTAHQRSLDEQETSPVKWIDP